MVDDLFLGLLEKMVVKGRERNAEKQLERPFIYCRHWKSGQI